MLSALGLTHFDAVLLHGPSEPFGYEGACGPAVCALNRAQGRAYQRFQRAGKARAAGVSNYCQSCLGEGRSTRSGGGSPPLIRRSRRGKVTSPSRVTK